MYVSSFNFFLYFIYRMSMYMPGLSAQAMYRHTVPNDYTLQHRRQLNGCILWIGQSHIRSKTILCGAFHYWCVAFTFQFLILTKQGGTTCTCSATRFMQNVLLAYFPFITKKVGLWDCYGLCACHTVLCEYYATKATANLIILYNFIQSVFPLS